MIRGWWLWVGLMCGCGSSVEFGADNGPPDGSGGQPPHEAPTSCVPGEERACYGGPTGTEGVGPCRAGTQVCIPSGTGFGPCEGAVVPTAEDCFNHVDDDCDGEAPFCPRCLQHLDAPDDLDAPNSQYGAAGIAVTLAGDVIAKGVAPPGLDVGSGPMSTSPDASEDPFWARYDPACMLTSSRHYVSPNKSFTGGAVGADSAGNAIILGDFNSPLDLGGTLLTPTDEMSAYLAKLSPSGAPIWGRVLSSTASLSVRSLTVGENDEIAINGIFRGTLTIPPLQLDAPTWDSPGFDPTVDHHFVAVLDGEGNAVQAIRVATQGVVHTDILRMARSPSGRMALSGFIDGYVYRNNWIVAGPQSHPAGFLAVLEPNGDLGHARVFDDGEHVTIQGVVFEGEDHYVTGRADGRTIDFGAGPQTRASDAGSNSFIARYGPEGQLRWARWIEGPGEVFNLNVTPDGAGHLYTCGVFEEGVTFDRTLAPFSGQRAVWLAQHDATTGEPRWSHRYGGPGDMSGCALGIGPDGSVAMHSMFRDTIRVGLTPLSAGRRDGFVAIFDP